MTKTNGEKEDILLPSHVIVGVLLDQSHKNPLGFLNQDPFDLYATARAIVTPHSVQEEYGDSPKRNKLKPPNRQGVVTGTGTAAN